MVFVVAFYCCFWLNHCLLSVNCYCNSVSLSNKFVLIIASLGNTCCYVDACSVLMTMMPCLVKLKHKLAVVILRLTFASDHYRGLFCFI